MCGFNTFILALFIFCTFNEVLSQFDVLVDSKSKRCDHQRAFEMPGAYCVGLKLEAIPDYLSTGIEILDFSENRLQSVKADTFASYTGLRYLYLSENQMYEIDKNAFAPLTYLQALDLSNNVILTLPETLFDLPSLRKLTLRNNPLLHLSFPNIQLNKPIKAPLAQLDISNCKLQSLPDWGSLPHLFKYNISQNPLKKLEAQHFATMCKLTKVDLSASIKDIKTCDLKPIINWFQEKQINFDLDDYAKLNSKEFEKCPADTVNFTHLNSTHLKCKASYFNFQSVKPPRRTWLTVTGGLAGFLVGFMILLYLMHRHNVAQTKTKAEKLKKSTPAHDADKTVMVPILVNEINDESQISRL